jgi:hypothetical protein
VQMALPVPVAAAVDVPRLPAPVESAAYFAVAECLANAAKHAAAGRVTVVRGPLRRRHGCGSWSSDDGRGGAHRDPAGSGLAGVERAGWPCSTADHGRRQPRRRADHGSRMEVPCRTP